MWRCPKGEKSAKTYVSYYREKLWFSGMIEWESIMPALWGQTLGFSRGIWLNFRDGFFIILHNICEVPQAIPPNPVPRTGWFWQISEKTAYFRAIFQKWDKLTYIITKDVLFSISSEVIMIFLLGRRVSGGAFRSQVGLKLTNIGLLRLPKWVSLTLSRPILKNIYRALRALRSSINSW